MHKKYVLTVISIVVVISGYASYALLENTHIQKGQLASVEHSAPPPTYTIGLVGEGPANVLVLDGFREKFSALLARKGKSATYLEWKIPATDVNNKNIADYFLANKVDLIVTAQFHIDALRERIKNIPIIVALPFDPSVLGDNMGNESNIVYSDSGAGIMTGERLRLFHELVPRAKIVLVLRGAPDLSGESSDGILPLYAEAKKDGITLVEREFRGRDELNEFLLTFNFNSVDAVYRYPGKLMAGNIDLFSLLRAKITKPFIVLNRFELENGGLISYGPDYQTMGEVAAENAHMILAHGVLPGNISTQKAHHFELGLNEIVAKQFGVTIPASLREAADFVVTEEKVQ